MRDMAAMMKEYGWRVPEAQRANLIMVEENMAALENGVQASTGKGRGGAERFNLSHVPVDSALAYTFTVVGGQHSVGHPGGEERAGGGGRRRKQCRLKAIVTGVDVLCLHGGSMEIGVLLDCGNGQGYSGKTHDWNGRNK